MKKVQVGQIQSWDRAGIGNEGWRVEIHGQHLIISRRLPVPSIVVQATVPVDQSYDGSGDWPGSALKGDSQLDGSGTGRVDIRINVLKTPAKTRRGNAVRRGSRSNDGRTPIPIGAVEVKEIEGINGSVGRGGSHECKQARRCESIHAPL